MRKSFSIFFSLTLLCFQVFAQQPFRGRIMGLNGSGLPGVSINVKGTRINTLSDDQGNFGINAAPGSVLVMSYLGQSQEYSVGDNSNVTIVFNERTNQLTEVVVTALGQTTRKAKLGYSASSFNSDL